MTIITSFDPKDPQEVDYWNIDFSDRMPADDTITSIVMVFEGEGDTQLELDQFAFLGQVVSGRWQAGTKGVTYLVTARVTTAQGRTLDKSGYVLVTDT
jgi:hypothetical protein